MELKRRKQIGAKFKIAGSSGKKAHVIARQGHWVIFKEGADRVLVKFDDRKSAISKGKKILNSGQVDALVLHKPDGTVEQLKFAD